MQGCHPAANCKEHGQVAKRWLLVVSPGDEEQPALVLPTDLPESSLQQVAALPAVNQLSSVHSSC